MTDWQKKIVFHLLKVSTGEAYGIAETGTVEKNVCVL